SSQTGGSLKKSRVYASASPGLSFIGRVPQLPTEYAMITTRSPAGPRSFCVERVGASSAIQPAQTPPHGKGKQCYRLGLRRNADIAPIANRLDSWFRAVRHCAGE